MMFSKLLYFFFLCPGIYLIYLGYIAVTSAGLCGVAKASRLLSEMQDCFTGLAGNVLTYATWNDEGLLYEKHDAIDARLAYDSF